DVGHDPAFADVRHAVELFERFAIGNQGPDAGPRVEGRDAGAAGPEPLGEGALWSEFDLELAGEVLLGEELVLAHIRGDDLADLAGFDEDGQALADNAHVVGDHRQVYDARIADRV